ncbi:hypothetical protein IKF15_02485 [Candidatus Saccharibacteria bacterium]|nr:hypothetical protein [Candidatus Saccharibacteria bacterium]
MDQNNNFGAGNGMPNGMNAVPSNGNVPNNGAPTASWMNSGNNAYGGGAPAGGMPATNGVPMQNGGVGMQATGSAGVPPLMPQQQSASVVAPLRAEKQKGSLLETIILVVVCLIAAAAIVAAVYFFMKFNELNGEQEIREQQAAIEAAAQQKEIDEKAREEADKEPNKEFLGPSDYGSISFYYPKTWSMYVEKDGTNNSDYQAYFRPDHVDPVSDRASRYSLRFSILNRQITDVQKTYQSKVQNGDMSADTFNADDNNISGTKYTGKIEEGIEGVVTLVKVNDKTVVLQTDAATYKADYEKLLQTLRRNS